MSRVEPSFISFTTTVLVSLVLKNKLLIVKFVLRPYGNLFLSYFFVKKIPLSRRVGYVIDGSMGQ